MRLIILIAACMGLWHGGDGLWVNLSSGKLTTFNINTVEEHGVGNSRFIKVTGGTWSNGLVYQVDQNTNQLDHVIFALESPETYIALEQGKSAPVHVLVKKKTDVHVDKLEEWVQQNGGSDEEVEIQGVTLVGFDSIDDESKSLIESMEMQLSDNVIFIDEGTEPRPITTNLAIFFPSLLFIGFMGYGLTRKKGEKASAAEAAQSAEQALNAIKKVMILMMLADGEIDEGERETIRNIYSQLTDSDYAAEQLESDIQQLQQEQVTLKELLKEMSDTLTEPGKVMALEAALLVAVADGVLADEEREVLHSIEVGLHIPDESLKQVYEKYTASDEGEDGQG